MKKVLFMAMAAVALMACNGNNGGGGNTPSKNVPEADKKAYTAASADLMALVGKDVAQTEKALKDAGYVKAEMGAEAAGALAPAKYKIPAAQKAAIEESLFVYNFPENLADEQAGRKYLDSIIAAGKGYAMAYVYSYQNNMVLVESNACLAITADANKMYAGISEKLYAGMPQTAIQKIYNGLNIIAKDTTKFDANQKFVEAIAKIDGAVIASEMAIAITSQQGDGFAFLDSWVNPDDATKETMKGRGLTPYVYASFLLGDYQMVDAYLEQSNN